jgi:hypothetical protein
MPKYRGSNRRRYHKCPEYGCRNPTEIQCKYCKQYFCKEHAAPKLVGTLNYIENVIKENDREKYPKYIEDYRRKDGHACGAYSTIWNREYDSKPRENLQEKFLTALDKLSPKTTYENANVTDDKTDERVSSRYTSESNRYNTRNYNDSYRRHSKRYRINFPRVQFPKLSIISIIFVVFIILLAIEYTINASSYLWPTADIFAFFLAVLVCYRLFVWASGLPTHSDLHLFGMRILGGFIALFGFFVIFFMPGLIIDSLYPNQGLASLQVGYVLPPVEIPITIFFAILGIGLIFLGAFLAFRFMRHSGIIVYQR